MSPSRSTLFLLLFALAAVWFGTLDYRALVRPDEGRYAEIPREMATTGDWVTPRLNGLKYFEKPPLQYWATATAYTLFGEHNWTARLWTALTGFLGVLLLYVAAHRLYGSATAIAAAAILASMQWYLLNAHFNTLDMGLTFFMEATLVGFLLAQHNAASATEERNWMIFAWIGMAGATLSKGLIGIVLPGAVLVLYTLLERDWRLWRRLYLGPGFALFAFLAVPWFVVCSAHNPEFFHFFFIHEHFERYLLHEHNREGDWWYFVPVLLLGVVPWTGHLLRLAPGMWAHTAGERCDGAKSFQPQRLLVIWSVFIFVFFSASNSKLVSYILPVFPALALLLAWRLPTLSARTFGLLVAPLTFVALAGIALVPGIVAYASPEMPAALFHAFEPWLYATAGVFALGTAGAAWLPGRRGVRVATLALAVASIATGVIALKGFDALSPSTSAYDLVRRVTAREGPLRADVPFFSVNMYEQTLPFYLKRPVTLVDYPDEMELGLAEEPYKGLPSQAAFRRVWRDLDQAYAIMEPGIYQLCARRGVPMRVLASDTRHVIVSRR